MKVNAYQISRGETMLESKRSSLVFNVMEEIEWERYISMLTYQALCADSPKSHKTVSLI